MSVPEEVINQPIGVEAYDPATENPARHAIEQIRDKIHMEAADPESLLGTTANAVQMLLYEVAALAAGLNAATTLEEVNAAAAPLNTMLAGFKAKVDDGTVKLPYRLEPIEDVFTEIETRATVVADVLIAAATPSS